MPALTPPATSDDTERNAGRRGPYSLNDEQAKWEPKEDALTLNGLAPLALRPRAPSVRRRYIFIFLGHACVSSVSSCRATRRAFLPFCTVPSAPVTARRSRIRLFATPGTTRFCLFVHPGFAFLCITLKNVAPTSLGMIVDLRKFYARFYARFSCQS